MTQGKRSGVIVPQNGLRLVRANNPSPMTHTGTNTFLLGEGEVAVIDPGPGDRAHLQAILDALAPGERVGAILVTHSHLDHSGLARPLAEATGAPVLAAGPSDWGRSAMMDRLAAEGTVGGGEGVDAAFRPDDPVGDGEIVEIGQERIEIVATPGHMANHLSFAWRGALFSGDLVMGWATSLVSPPDGDMTAFFASMERLSAREDRRYYPGHGDPVDNPAERVAELVAHRRGRERAILDALSDGPADAAALARRIYTDLPERMLPMAARNVLAHLLDLLENGAVAVEGTLSAASVFRTPG